MVGGNSTYITNIWFINNGIIKVTFTEDVQNLNKKNQLLVIFPTLIGNITANMMGQMAYDIYHRYNLKIQN
jgi:hypothetical protein